MTNRIDLPTRRSLKAAEKANLIELNHALRQLRSPRLLRVRNGSTPLHHCSQTRGCPLQHAVEPFRVSQEGRDGSTRYRRTALPSPYSPTQELKKGKQRICQKGSDKYHEN